VSGSFFCISLLMELWLVGRCGWFSIQFVGFLLVFCSSIFWLVVQIVGGSPLNKQIRLFRDGRKPGSGWFRAVPRPVSRQRFGPPCTCLGLR
jgi:hypothetical protein